MQPVNLTEFKTPGADLGGIYYLRDIRDGEKLLEGIAKAKAAGNKVRTQGRPPLELGLPIVGQN